MWICASFCSMVLQGHLAALVHVGGRHSTRVRRFLGIFGDISFESVVCVRRIYKINKDVR